MRGRVNDPNRLYAVFEYPRRAATIGVTRQRPQNPVALSNIYDPAYEYVLEKLRQARLDAGLRQEDVARIMRVDQRYISRMEIGGRRVDLVELSFLAILYRKPLSYFFPPRSELEKNRRAMRGLCRYEEQRDKGAKKKTRKTVRKTKIRRKARKVKKKASKKRRRR